MFSGRIKIRCKEILNGLCATSSESTCTLIIKNGKLINTKCSIGVYNHLSCKQCCLFGTDCDNCGDINGLFYPHNTETVRFKALMELQRIITNKEKELENVYR
jgi:hypothetical protein